VLRERCETSSPQPTLSPFLPSTSETRQHRTPSRPLPMITRPHFTTFDYLPVAGSRSSPLDPFTSACALISAQHAAQPRPSPPTAAHPLLPKNFSPSPSSLPLPLLGYLHRLLWFLYPLRPNLSDIPSSYLQLHTHTHTHTRARAYTERARFHMLWEDD
jgi:hypothetical protein